VLVEPGDVRRAHAQGDGAGGNGKAAKGGRMKPLRKLKIKVFTIGNKSHKTIHLSVPKGMQYKDGGEDIVLRQFADEIEKSFPNDHFSLKQIGRGEYNFVWVGKKPVDPATLVVAGMAVGEVTSVEVGAQ
jgi:hypothetical protein